MRAAVQFAALDEPALHALLDGDLDAASEASGVRLPEFFLQEGWLWRIRLDRIRADPDVASWFVRATVTETGDVVGHAGFHGPPDAAGMVEIGYTVIPERRGEGWAHATVAALLAEAAAHESVSVVRACVSPDNAASLAVIRGAGLTHIGERCDDTDGLELVFETTLRRDGSAT